jgi:hypothetical protein
MVDPVEIIPMEIISMETPILCNASGLRLNPEISVYSEALRPPLFHDHITLRFVSFFFGN